jgi:hypothetical protein
MTRHSFKNTLFIGWRQPNYPQMQLNCAIDDEPFHFGLVFRFHSFLRFATDLELYPERHTQCTAHLMLVPDAPSVRVRYKGSITEIYSETSGSSLAT